MLDDKKIADLKAKFGEHLVAVETSDGLSLVFRKPKRQEYDRWFDNRDEKGTAAARELATQVLVDPSYEEFMGALDKQPAILMCKNGVLDAITDLAGFAGATAPKKL